MLMPNVNLPEEIQTVQCARTMRFTFPTNTYQQMEKQVEPQEIQDITFVTYKTLKYSLQQ